MPTLTKRRILVTRFPYESRFGGEEVHTLSLMRALRERGHSVFFLGSCPVLLEEFRKAGGSRGGFEVSRSWLMKPPVTPFWLVLFTLMSPVLFLWAGGLLWRARRRWKVDTLYALSFGEKLLMTPWARLFRMRVIWLEHARIGNWLTKNPWKFWYRFWSRRRGVVTVVTSNAMKTRLMEAVYGEGEIRRRPMVLAIPCWVDLKAGSQVDLKAPGGTLKPEWKAFMNKGFCVGTVCRLTEDKGVDRMVKLVESQPEIRAVIVGEGPLEGLIWRSPARERILHIKHLDRAQLSALYRALDVFVLASTQFDPFGMVAAEAMWSGTAVVVTDECGISGDLLTGGNLVSELQAMVISTRYEDLEAAVLRLKKNSDFRARLAKEGQKFAQSQYRLERLVDRFEDLLVG